MAELCACGCGAVADGYYDAESIPGLMDCQGLPYSRACRLSPGIVSRMRAARSGKKPGPRTLAEIQAELGAINSAERQGRERRLELKREIERMKEESDGSID